MSWGFGWLAAGIVFLCNPVVNVIDYLPDALGWLFLALGLTRFSYLRDDMAAVRKNAWILCGVSVVKLLPMFWSLSGENRFPLAAEPTMVLTYALCFSVVELIFALPALTGMFRILIDAAPFSGNGKTIRKASSLRTLTVWFFLLRAACSMIPELVYLRSTEYLGDIVYAVVIDIRTYRPYLIVFFSLIAGIVGLVWMIRSLKFFRCAATDKGYRASLDALAENRAEEMRCKSTLAHYVRAFVLFLLGAVFFCAVSIENLPVLPYSVGVLLTALALRLCAPPSGKQRLQNVLTFTAALAYDVWSIGYGMNAKGFWADNLVDYFRRNVTLSPEKQAEAMRMQLLFLGTTAVFAAILVFWFARAVKQLTSLDELSTADGVTLYDSMTKDMMRTEKEKYRKQPKQVLLWFAVSTGFEIVRNLPMFAFVVTPISLAELILNILFLVRLYGWLSTKYRMLQYHFRYNTAEDEPHSAS